MCVYLFFLKFFSYLGYYRILNRSCAIQEIQEVLNWNINISRRAGPEAVFISSFGEFLVASNPIPAQIPSATPQCLCEQSRLVHREAPGTSARLVFQTNPEFSHPTFTWYYSSSGVHASSWMCHSPFPWIPLLAVLPSLSFFFFSHHYLLKVDPLGSVGMLPSA